MDVVGTELVLRAATQGDIPALAEIAAAAYAGSFAAILEPQALAARGPAFFSEHFATRIDRMVVAEQQGRPVAFTLVTDRHLDMMFVAAAARRSGAGAALLERAEAQGLRSLECFRDNLAARAFYEAKGWRLTRAYEREFIGRQRAFVFYEKAQA